MEAAPRRRIGIFGGSFNPVHVGHMMLSQYLAEFGGLDEVWLLLSARNPLKEAVDGVTDNQRLDMLRIACADTPRLVASDFELSLPRPSYTYLTLRALSEQYPECDFTLLIGADNWAIFDRWRNADEIINRYRIMIYPRTGSSIEVSALPPTVSYIPQAPIIDVSSTFLRDAIAAGHCVNQFLPSGVYEYITTHHIYGL